LFIANSSVNFTFILKRSSFSVLLVKLLFGSRVPLLLHYVSATPVSITNNDNADDNYGVYTDTKAVHSCSPVVTYKKNPLAAFAARG